MKSKQFRILLVIPLLILSFSNTSERIYPNNKIQTDILKDLDSCIQQLSLVSKNLGDNDIVELLSSYKNIRTNYKKIESYVVFRYPVIDKSINGGPVPSFTKDVVIIHKDDPTGLQVIEEIINSEEIDLIELKKQLLTIYKNLNILKGSISKLPIQNWEILEANHLAITRMITLSLSGFDSPEFLLSIDDSKTVLKQIKRDLIRFKPFTNQKFDWNNFEKIIYNSVEYLTKNQNFNELNRFEYYKNYLLPLQTQIKSLHTNTGYESYSEVTNIKRSIGKGDHLFSEKYLDPHYSMRGNNTSHNQDQIDLGKTLFYDPVLSKDNNFSCASCHNPKKAFTDGVDKSFSSDLKSKVERNSPTLINSSFQNNFFWDLRSSDMNDQIMNVILNKHEFNTSPDEIVLKLRESEGYKTLFQRAYFAHSTPITIGTVKSSLELYVRSLVNLNSKFDRNIKGEENSLTTSEVNGANLFLGKAACATCHFPPNFNGYVPPHFQDTEGEILGVLSHPNSNELDKDMGMYERFKNSYPEAQYINGMFKTPTIRNIELTGPYMHNGKYNTLEEVVSFYNHGGAAGKGIDLPQQTLGSDSLHLSDQEQIDIVAFMKTLTDTSNTVVNPFKLPDFKDSLLNKRVWGGVEY